MSKRTMSAEDRAIMKALKATIAEQEAAFQKNRKKGEKLYVLDTIHPAYYEKFANKLETAELKSLITEIAGVKHLHDDFWRKISDETIERALETTEEFRNFLKKVEEERVNDFLEAEAKYYCVNKFPDFQFLEQFEMLNRLSKDSFESFFAEIIYNYGEKYVAIVAEFLKKLDSKKTEQNEEALLRFCQMTPTILANLIEMGQKIQKEEHEMQEEEHEMQEEEHEMQEEEHEMQEEEHEVQEEEHEMKDILLRKLSESGILSSQFSTLEAVYHVVPPEDKVYILEHALAAEKFGALYAKLSKDEQDEIFELILGENLSKKKVKLLRQQAVEVLEKKEERSCFENAILDSLYQVIKTEEKVEYVLDDVSSTKDFGALYQQLTRDEQEKIFELISGEKIGEKKQKLLRKIAITFLEQKENRSYFENATLKDLQSQMES